MKYIPLLLIGLVFYIEVQAQSAPAPVKPTPAASATLPAGPASPPSPSNDCFPSGSSLVGAHISTDGKYFYVDNVRKVWKYFDAHSLALVSVCSADDNKWKANHDKFISGSDPDAEPENFTIEQIEHAPGKPDYTFNIKDKSGAVVATYDAKGQMALLFVKSVGALIISYQKGKKYDCVLIRPGKPNKKIYKKDEIYGVRTFVSPDSRFLITENRHVVDLEEGEVVEVEDDDENMHQLINIGFRERSDEFFTSNIKDGIVTYSCKTGKRVGTIPIPAELPRIKGFEVLVAPNGQDFLYYLYFDNVWASAGLAYWVHDGKGVSLCDPNWKDEQSENYFLSIKAGMERMANESRKAEEEERKAALARSEMRKTLDLQDAYRREQATGGVDKGTTTSNYSDCPVCNGRGTISQNNIDYYKTTREYSSGAGSGSTNYRVVRTPVYSRYGTPTTCSRCNGSGLVRKN